MVGDEVTKENINMMIAEAGGEAIVTDVKGYYVTQTASPHPNKDLYVLFSTTNSTKTIKMSLLSRLRILSMARLHSKGYLSTFLCLDIERQASIE
jgi:hypothetical protein